MIKIVLFASLLLPIMGLISSKKETPNVVLIYIDDLGYGDIGVNGAQQYATPHIDQMASEGMRFTNFLTAQAVCSASRAALLTGCYPNRIGITGALFPNSKIGINPDEQSMAELFKEKGYNTAIFGKWHLGDQQKFSPLQHGFDEFLGIPYSNDMWPVYYDGSPAKPEQLQYRFPPLHLIENNTKVKEIKNLDDQDQLTTIFTDKAVSYIKKQGKKPFFVYMPLCMPHVPLGVSSKFKGKSKEGKYGDVIMEMDWAVGQILAVLKAQKKDKNTIVIFTSDNGPWLNFGNHAGSAGGFREGKGTAFEGGHRVPMIVKWPGKVGTSVCNKLSSTIDLLPTLVEICGLNFPSKKIDGVSLKSLWDGKDTHPRKTFYYYYDKNNLKFVRRDNWKLALAHQSQTYEANLPGNDGFGGKTKQDMQVPMALYDLRRDPGERYDVQSLYPDIVKELQVLAEEARNDLGDALTNREGKNVRKAGEGN